MTYPPLLSRLPMLPIFLAGLAISQVSAGRVDAMLAAHHRVLETIKAAPRKLSHISEEGNVCSVCYGGVHPHHPSRKLLLDVDEYEIVGADDLFKPSLTCSEYSTTFLSRLFPDEPSCQAFQGSVADVCGCPRPPSVW